MHFVVPFMYLELKILSAAFPLNVKWLLLLKVRPTNAPFMNISHQLLNLRAGWEASLS